jgi:selenocysteine-specific elongation factor
MIVGTAGHIDHGKTTLVRALTGVDTDRLPEEKRRGITIELGYAFMDAGGPESIGFVDVPGHERLVHTMLAGATGIDRVLLVVAADDGPMPQTREHLAITTLLGIDAGAVVITKCDRVDAARLAQLDAQLDALLLGSALSGAPRFRTCAQTGEGVAALKDWLASQAQALSRDDDVHEGFRLAIDRVFTLQGVGTVATGTVFGGTVRPGDELQVTPAGPRVRVRGVHAQNRPATAASRGQRCALNLAGVERARLERGQWLCTPSVALSTDRIDARISVWSGEPNALDSGQTVHLHLGAKAALARVVLLQDHPITPGTQGLAQLILHESISAWRGDRFVLRDASANRTLAGGRVLDPFAPMRYRRTPQRLAQLQALQAPSAPAQVQALAQVSPLGVPLARFAQAGGLTDLLLQPQGLVAVDAGAPRWLLDAAHWAQIQQQLLEALTRFHEHEPDVLGLDAGRLRRLCLPRAQPELVEQAIAALLAQGAVTRTGAFLHRPEHQVRLGEAEQKIAQMLLPLIAQGGRDPPWVRDLARQTGLSEPTVRTTLLRLGRRGDVFAIVRDLYYGAAVVGELAALARGLAAQSGTVRAASFRDATGLGRKRAIQVLEFFDRIGVLRRVGDAHRPRTDCAMFL